MMTTMMRTPKKTPITMPAMAPLLSSRAAAVAMADTVLGGGGAACNATSLKPLWAAHLQMESHSQDHELLENHLRLEPCHDKSWCAVESGRQR